MTAPSARNLFVGAAVGLALVGGCAPVAPPAHRHAGPAVRVTPPGAPRPAPVGGVAPAAATEPAAPPAGVDDFVRLAVAQNPRLARARFGIDAASGRLVQAGLYPNPTFWLTGDELGDRTGPAGIWTPALYQEIVTAGKRPLAQAVAAADVDQAVLGLLAERYALAAAVRAAYYDALALQERVAILDRFVAYSTEAVRRGREQVAAKQIAPLDLLQLETELETFRADAEAARRELPATYRRLAAVSGDSVLPVGPLPGSLAGVPEYDLGAVRAAVLAAHPEVRTSRVAVERARAAVRQAEANRVPNVTLVGGYTYQDQNKSNDGAFGVSAPIPVWNKNQGNIRAAKAELGQAAVQVARVENDLDERVAVTFRTYAAGRERAERYRAEVLPRAVRAAQLTLKAFEGGQVDSLKVLQSQRAVTEAGLEYNTSLGQAWRAAAELSGLLMEEVWPPPPPKPEERPKLPEVEPKPDEKPNPEG